MANIVDLTDTPMDFKLCQKLPLTVWAVQIKTAFQVTTPEGIMVGKYGDYLICGIDNERYICKKDIFERSYIWSEEEII